MAYMLSYFPDQQSEQQEYHDCYRCGHKAPAHVGRPARLNVDDRARHMLLECPANGMIHRGRPKRFQEFADRHKTVPVGAKLLHDRW